MDNLISENFHRDAALTWYDQGFSVIPVRSDGSKRPTFDRWKPFMSERATRSLTAKWYEQDPTRGVGLICGKISGDLEMTELEGDFTSGEALDKLRVECDARDITWLWDLLTLDGYAEWTANGGIHTVYRISDHDVPGNTKLAMDVDSNVTYAETRGEGGFVVVAPTFIQACRHTPAHEEGDNWVVAAGEIGKVPTITWADRSLLHEAIKAAFDERVERVERVYEAPAPQPIRERAPGEVSVVDDFNAHGDWTTILTERGWSYAGKQGGQDTWTRPGKDPRDGHSAALGYQGSPNLYVWSGMPEERHYTKYQFVGFSDFNGDWAATTKHLASQGYGTPLEPRTSKPSRSDYDYSDLLPEKGAPMVESSESETTEISEPSEPKQRPRIEKWTGVGAGRFAGKIFGEGFCEVTEEFSERGARGWRVYDGGRWREDMTRQVREAMIKVSDMIEAQAEAIRDRAAEAFATNESKENKQALTQASTLVTFAKNVASDSGIKALTNMFAASSGVTRSIKEFDSNPALLCLKNGTFDLKTMTLREHDRKDLLTRRMDIEFSPEATCPLWDQSLIDWLPDPEIRAYVQRALGYTLLGNVEEGVFFVPWGDTGCGKSQFIETIKDVFGDFGTTAEASTFRDKVYGSSDSTNNLHDLRGRRFVASSETTKGAGLNEELVKRATGEEALKTRALYQSNIEWTPEFVLWIATNFKPALSADDGAIWRRVKPIHFPNNFSESADRIKGLGKKMRADEMAGIFNWLLEGVRAYREIGLAEPASLSLAVKEYREEQDPIAQFVAEELAGAGRIEVGDGLEVESSKLYNVYLAYCAENGVRYPLSSGRFGRALTARGFGDRRGTNGVRMRTGIRTTWMRDAHSSMHGWTQGKS